MNREITLYGSGTSRSSRCLWTLRELGVEFSYVDDSTLLGSEKLKRLQPQGKLPVVVIDGESLFESSAICTYLCDLYPEKGLIGAVGSRERALHEQWCSFALTEVEGYLWSSYKHGSFYPAEKRVPAVLSTNTEEILAGLMVLERVLARQTFLLGSKFSVTDIVVGFAINWSKSAGHLGEFTALSAYLDRLYSRELCAFKQHK